MASGTGLTEEQKRRMDENRRRAMEKRAQRLNQQGVGSNMTMAASSSSSSSSSSSAPNKTHQMAYQVRSTGASTVGAAISQPRAIIRKSIASSSSSASAGGAALSVTNQTSQKITWSSLTGSLSGAVKAPRPDSATARSSEAPGWKKLWRPSCADSLGASRGADSLGASRGADSLGASRGAAILRNGGQVQQHAQPSTHQQQPQAQASCNGSGQKTITQFYSSGSSSAVRAQNSSRPEQQQDSANRNKNWKKASNTGNAQSRSASGTLKAAGGDGSSASLSGSCVLVSRSRFMVDIGYHSKLIELFKSIASKSYDANSKKWSFSLSNYDELITAVQVLQHEVEVKPLPSCVCLAFRSQRQGQHTSMQVPDANLDGVDQKLVEALMPFQRAGVNFGIHRGGRVLIADEMGLGKTIQAICIACYYRSEWPLLIVAPSSMRFSWAEAFMKWVPSLEEHEINVVTSGKENVGCGLINIVSYDIMSRQARALQSKRFKVIIMDESHFLKNYKTARTKAALPMLKAAARVVLLSGTPALSRPSELFQQINVVNPRLFPSFHDFAVRYCDAKQTHFGWDYSGSSNLSELQLLLEEKVMVRRLKKDVLKQLPSKIRQVIMMDPGIVKTSSRSLKSAAKEMEQKTKSEQHGALLKYFSETGLAKVPALREYVLDLADCGHKFLVFAHHQTVLDAMSEALVKHKIKFIRVDGSTSSYQRKELVDKFQTNDSYQVAVLSITACNAGITLTSASTVLFAELFWNPGILVQAEDRVHRIGQQDSVTVRYLIAKGTADDYIWPLVQKKLSTLSKAGLSRDDFGDADTTEFRDPRQRSILSFFEQSFFEDSFSQEELDILDAAMATGCDPKTSVAGGNPGNGERETPTTKTDVPAFKSSKAKPAGLFSSFQPAGHCAVDEADGPLVKRPKMK